MKAKRILMFGTRFDTMGGIASVVNVYRDSGLFARFPVTYIPTHRDGSAFEKLAIFAAACVKYCGFLVTNRVGLIHVHMSSRSSFWRKTLILVPAYLLGVKTVVHLHGSEFAVFFEQECGAFAKAAVRYVFRNASRVVVLSRNWLQWVERTCPQSAVLAIYNPILDMPREPEWDSRSPGTVLFLGRLGTRKGVYDLLAAARVVASRCPELKIYLGGDGETDQVARRADELGISGHVEVLGWVSGEAKERLLRSAWLYVLPSYNEGLPMSILEAMAAGLPVLSTPIAGIPEAVTDGKEGYLVPPGDVDRLAERLERLLKEPGLAREMGKAAQQKVESTFSARVILPKLECLYRQLVQNGDDAAA